MEHPPTNPHGSCPSTAATWAGGNCNSHTLLAFMDLIGEIAGTPHRNLDHDTSIQGQINPGMEKIHSPHRVSKEVPHDGSQEGTSRVPWKPPILKEGGFDHLPFSCGSGKIPGKGKVLIRPSVAPSNI